MKPEHYTDSDGKPYAVYNPKNVAVETLPTIFGFNNGGSHDWWSACLLAEDGNGLGGHICSHEVFMPGDLGCIEGSRPDRHEGFKKHYPNGYRMAFIPLADVEACQELMQAYALNQKLAKESQTEKLSD